MKRLLTVVLTLFIVNSSLVYGDEFQVLDIRIEGLQRVSAGTVFASLPINVGDFADDASIRQATRSLFRTGYFADVIMARENGILVIGLIERPAVTEINIEGNKAIETDQLMDALRDNGLAEGQIFRQVILEGMSQELQRQYVSQGRYGALVQTEVKELPRNREEYRELYDPSKLNFKELEMERSTIEDEEIAFKVDFQKDSYFGDLPSTIKFGFKYRSREVTKDWTYS